MSWTKPYTVDTGPSGDSKYTGFVKTGGNIDDLYTNANLLKNTHIGTAAPTSPDTGQLWLDSNYTPPKLKQYNGTSWGLVAHAGFVAPRGFLINGKISVTVASNNLTVAIKTLADADPSTTDPVYCRIGDVVYSITAALSVTKAAGTNWFGACTAPVGGSGASGAQDYFVYLGYNATDRVVIGFARIPNGTRYDSFSTTSTDPKYCAISTITTADAADVYENIGRFAATLGQAATYLWSVATFTADTLIQRPIYETRVLSWSTTMASSAGTLTSYSVSTRYWIRGGQVFYEIKVTITTNGTGSGYLTVSGLPFDNTTAVTYTPFYGIRDAPTWAALNVAYSATTTIVILLYEASYPGADGATMYLAGSITY